MPRENISMHTVPKVIWPKIELLQCYTLKHYPLHITCINIALQQKKRKQMNRNSRNPGACLIWDENRVSSNVYSHMEWWTSVALPATDMYAREKNSWRRWIYKLTLQRREGVLPLTHRRWDCNFNFRINVLQGPHTRPLIDGGGGWH